MMNMNFKENSARFTFFNGRERYTVEYSYYIATWFVFEGEKTTDATLSVFSKQDKKIAFENVNSESACTILFEYFKKITYEKR